MSYLVLNNRKSTIHKAGKSLEFLASYLWEKRGSQTNSGLLKLNYSNYLSVDSYLLTYAETKRH